MFHVIRDETNEISLDGELFRALLIVIIISRALSLRGLQDVSLHDSAIILRIYLQNHRSSFIQTYKHAFLTRPRAPLKPIDLNKLRRCSLFYILSVLGYTVLSTAARMHDRFERPDNSEKTECNIVRYAVQCAAVSNGKITSRKWDTTPRHLPCNESHASLHPPKSPTIMRKTARRGARFQEVERIDGALRAQVSGFPLPGGEKRSREGYHYSTPASRIHRCHPLVRDPHARIRG